MIRTMGIAIDDLRDEDSDQLFAWINDPELGALTNTNFQETPREVHDAWFAGAKASGTVWAIREDDALLGIGQLIVEGDEGEIRVRLGASGSRSRGLGTLVALEIIRRGFSELGLRRIWSQVPKNNERAMNVNRRVGFREYGETDEVVLFDQGPGARWRESSSE
jgi:RimJ/RimL family protein N-acetyltransferase